jgi:hypothetical protein
MTMNDTDGNRRKDSFLHLNALKVDWNSSCKVTAAYLVPAEALAIESIGSQSQPFSTSYYNLQGQKVERPTRGIYIRNGKKMVVR